MIYLNSHFDLQLTETKQKKYTPTPGNKNLSKQNFDEKKKIEHNNLLISLLNRNFIGYSHKYAINKFDFYTLYIVCLLLSR